MSLWVSAREIREGRRPFRQLPPEHNAVFSGTLPMHDVTGTTATALAQGVNDRKARGRIHVLR